MIDAAARERQLLREARAAGSGAPEDTPFFSEITYLDPATGETTLQGYLWLVEEAPETRAALMTWLLPEAIIPADKLDAVERYAANMSMAQVLFDEIAIARTGRVIDLGAEVTKLRALRAGLAAQRDQTA